MAASTSEEGLAQELLVKGQNGGMAGVPRIAWTLVLWWTMVGIGVALAMLGPTLQELALQLQLPLATAGTLFTWRALGYLLGAVWCGDLLQRIPNPAAVFLAPTAVAGMGTLVLPHIESYTLTCILLSFQGISMGMFDTGGNVLMLALWRGSPYQNGFEHAFHFLFGLGAAIAPLIVRTFLVRGFDALLAWPVVSVLLLPSGLGLLALSCTPQPKICEEAPDSQGSHQAGASKIVFLTGAFLFVYVGIEVAFGGYVDTFSVRWLGASKVAGATLTSVYWASLSAGRGLAAVVTPFVNHAWYIGLHLALAIVAITVMGIASTDTSAVAPLERGWWIGIVTPTALFGLGLAPLFPGALLVAEELLAGPLPAHQAGRVVGAAAAGEMCLPMLVGALFALTPESFCWSQLVLCVSSASIFLVNSMSVLRRSKG